MSPSRVASCPFLPSAWLDARPRRRRRARVSPSARGAHDEPVSRGWAFRGERRSTNGRKRPLRFMEVDAPLVRRHHARPVVERRRWLSGIDRRAGQRVRIHPRGTLFTWVSDLAIEAAARHVQALASPLTVPVLHVGPGIVFANPPPTQPRPSLSLEAAATCALRACEVAARLHARGVGRLGFGPSHLRLIEENGDRQIRWLVPGVPDLDFVRGALELAGDRAKESQHPRWRYDFDPILHDLWQLSFFFFSLLAPEVQRGGGLDPDGREALGTLVRIRDEGPEGAGIRDAASMAGIFTKIAPLPATSGEALPVVRVLPRLYPDWDDVVADGEVLLKNEARNPDYFASRSRLRTTSAPAGRGRVVTSPRRSTTPSGPLPSTIMPPTTRQGRCCSTPRIAVPRQARRFQRSAKSSMFTQRPAGRESRSTEELDADLARPAPRHCALIHGSTRPRPICAAPRSFIRRPSPRVRFPPLRALATPVGTRAPSVLHSLRLPRSHPSPDQTCPGRRRRSPSNGMPEERWRGRSRTEDLAATSSAPMHRSAFAVKRLHVLPRAREARFPDPRAPSPPLARPRPHAPRRPFRPLLAQHVPLPGVDGSALQAQGFLRRAAT